MENVLEFYRTLPQQGPGTDTCTWLALRHIKDLPDNPDILDIGCGTGRSTRVLAEKTGGKVTAVDFYGPFLEDVRNRLAGAGLGDKLTTTRADMRELPFEKNSFDLIWSEGAIYNMGFVEGLTAWKDLIRPNGFLVVSDATWLDDPMDPEITEYWEKNYPGMTTIQGNLDRIAEGGYHLITYFKVPDAGWWDSYYLPIEAALKEHRVPDEMVDEFREEIQMYRKYARYYGYVFYIMQKFD